jgi:hypothetical protein
MARKGGGNTALQRQKRQTYLAVFGPRQLASNLSKDWFELRGERLALDTASRNSNNVVEQLLYVTRGDGVGNVSTFIMGERK